MDSAIQKAFKKNGRSLLPFGRLEELAGSDHIAGDPYFFLKRELALPVIKGPRNAYNRHQFQEMKDSNKVSHVTLMTGGEYYDYTFEKAYATLEEWVQYIDGKMEDVVFGVNRVHMTTRPVSYHIPLKTLLSELGHEDEEKDEIDVIVEKVLARLLGRELRITIT